jgi:hypothetical protein
VGDLAERHAAREALLLDSLPIGGIGYILCDEAGGLDMGAPLVVGAVRDAPTAPAPFARAGVAFEPSGTDAALDLFAVQSPERFVERSAAVLADEDRGFRIGCDRRSLHPWVADG